MEFIELFYLPNEIMESMLGDLQSPSLPTIFRSVTPCLTKNWGDLPLKAEDAEDLLTYGLLRDAVSAGWVPFELRSQGQENAVCYQVASRSKDSVIHQHGPNIEGLTGYVSAKASQRKQVAKESAFAINGTNVTKKLSKVWTLDKEYRISRNVLEQHSQKKLGEVAEILGVSRSTLKRICRKHHIFRWPPCKAKNSNRCLTWPKFVQTTKENVEESTRRNQSLYNSTQEMNSVSNAQAKSNETEVPNHSSMTVKATYKDDIIKFQLSVSSTKLDLEEVATRLRLSVGSFKIKCLDEDGDWILIACDTDLRTCISTLASVGKTTIKMLVC